MLDHANMVTRFLISAIFSIQAFALFADEWHKGSLILKSQYFIQGQISIRHEHDVILCKVGKEVTVYPAHKVLSFNIYDESEESNRQFVSLQLSFGAATYHQFYEVILDGDVSVLRRQRTVWYSVHLDTIEFDYYIRNNEELVSFHQFRRKVFPVLEQSSGTLTSFMRENKLNTHRLDDVIRIIDHFNQQQVARASVR